MSRRALLLLLVSVAVPAGLIAQTEPFLGIWELNLSKSSITRGAPPLSETVVNVAQPGGFSSTLAVVSERATRLEIHHYKLDGSFHQTEGSHPRPLSFKPIAQNTIEQHTRRNGPITVN